MSDVRYLIDTNALNKLTRAQRAGDFVRTRCRLPSEVLHEARDLSDHPRLRALDYPVTPAILEKLRSVMASLPANDHTLVDLYRNEGNADPILIATALVADHGEGSLWQTEWRIVTDDKALRSRAAELSIACLHTTEFVKLLDG